MESPPLRIKLTQCFAIEDEVLQEKVDKIFFQHDKDLDDCLDYDEARPFLFKQLGHDMDLESAQLLFDEIDANKNGSISREELLEYFKN